MTDVDSVLRGVVERIVGQFNPEKIILFGSYARGKGDCDSDLDIMVVMRVEGSRRRMANEIDLALADRTLPLDLIVVTPEQFARRKDIIGTIVREAALEGRVLYERAA